MININTQEKTTLTDIRHTIGTGEVEKILKDLKQQGKNRIGTDDIIRELTGSFIINKGKCPAHSFNSNFGKFLKENSRTLGIKEYDSEVPTKDDNGRKTKVSIWEIL